MKTLYFDCSMGAAGDMLSAALLELFPEPETVLSRLNGLGIPGVRFVREEAFKCGIRGTHLHVLIDGEEEIAPGACGEDASGEVSAHEHIHKHEQHHAHDEEGRHHDQHDHSHSDDHGHHHIHRSMADIEAIVNGLALPAAVRNDILAVYRLIADAESEVHGRPVSEVHFHEVGAMDAVADITAFCLLMHELAPDEVVASPIHVGSGQVRCAHGILPVPAPATAELLQGIPHYRGSVAKEMTTPTGAALLKALAVPVEEAPAGFTGEVIGYGAGTRDVAIPNVLRVNVGAWEEKTNTVHSAGAKDCGEPAGTATVCAVTGIAADAIAHTGAQATDATDSVETLLALECNLDDMNPELLPYVMEKLLAAGANDAWLQPIIMKKGRPAHLLKVLCAPEQQPAMQRILFTETTTLGVRAYPVQRTALERRWRDVATPWGNVRVKEGVLNGEVVNAAPEFEDCKRVATESGQPLKVIEASALQPNH